MVLKSETDAAESIKAILRLLDDVNIKETYGTMQYKVPKQCLVLYERMVFIDEWRYGSGSIYQKMIRSDMENADRAPQKRKNIWHLFKTCIS